MVIPLYLLGSVVAIALVVRLVRTRYARLERHKATEGDRLAAQLQAMSPAVTGERPPGPTTSGTAR